jgi:orotate phosphoribosyltransferase
VTEDLGAHVPTELPERRGHFLLESGLHTDRWLTLDSLFVDGGKIAPSIAALADRLRPHAVTGVCGPLLGGAFLAQALASTLGVRFYYAERSPDRSDDGIFRARYDLPSEQRRRLAGERIAVVDDVISAGSSVRATATALTSAGASIAVVAAFLILGDAASTHFAGLGIPMEALGRRGLALWKPGDCPLCLSGAPLEDPRQTLEAPAPGPITLVVLLHCNPGHEEELDRFEDAAARIMRRYGGRMERRIPLARSAALEDQPHEVHVVTFPDQASFDRYREDTEIQALADLRARAIRRTTVWHSL